LCAIWLFADLRGIASLGNSVIDMLHERQSSRWLVEGSVIKHVYNNTTSGAKLRVFIVDWCAMTTGNTETFMRCTQKKHQTLELLQEMVHAMTDRESQDYMTRLDRCRWHDHSRPGGKLRLDSRK
jgi:hypothetical protein